MAILSHRCYLLVGLFLAPAFVVIAASAPAHAARCIYVEQSYNFNGIIHVKLVEVCSGSDVSGTYDPGGGGPVTSGIDPICASTAISNHVDPATFCEPSTDDSEPGSHLPDAVAIAFAQMQVPPAVIEVEPPNGRTLVNFDTNFYTRLAPVTESLPLLGKQVEIRAEPTQFLWQFGDGSLLSTSRAGSPYPDLDVTHRFQKRGTVSPRVDASWSATYRVDGGDWLPVRGTLLINGTPADLQVVTATPTLVGYQ